MCDSRRPENGADSFDPPAAVATERICPRCKRATDGWPLRRADVCSPRWWGRCIRTPQPDWPLVTPEMSRAAEIMA